jgi:protein SCO1
VVKVILTFEFHPKFIGLTGTYQQIKKIAKSYRLYFSAPPKALDDDDADYLVDHSIFFYLVGPEGDFIEHYGRNDTSSEVANKILQHLKTLKQ